MKQNEKGGASGFLDAPPAFRKISYDTEEICFGAV